MPYPTGVEILHLSLRIQALVYLEKQSGIARTSLVLLYIFGTHLSQERSLWNLVTMMMQYDSFRYLGFR